MGKKGKMDDIKKLSTFILNNFIKNDGENDIVGEYIFNQDTFENTFCKNKVVCILIKINSSNKNFFELYIGDMKYQFDTIDECLCSLHVSLNKTKIEKKGLGLL